MAIIPNIFKDAALTQPFDDAVDTLDGAALNGNDGDGYFYVGLTDTANKLQASSNPGVDPLTISITDASPGVDVEAADIKLASSQSGLGSAVGGNPLNIGAEILGGAAPNAYQVWFRWANSEGAGTYTDISLNINARVEVAI